MQTILQMHPDVQYIMSFLYTVANWAVLSATLGKPNRIGEQADCMKMTMLLSCFI